MIGDVVVQVEIRSRYFYASGSLNSREESAGFFSERRADLLEGAGCTAGLGGGFDLRHHAFDDQTPRVFLQVAGKRIAWSLPELSDVAQLHRPNGRVDHLGRLFDRVGRR